MKTVIGNVMNTMMLGLMSRYQIIIICFVQ